VIRFDPAKNGPLEDLIAHEGTHVLAYQAWGAAGTPLMGEGVAMWASGSYGGTPLDTWRQRLAGKKQPTIATLLGNTFRQMPEEQTYPLAGIFFDVAVTEVGQDNVRVHLYGATALNWDRACTRAGTTPEKLQAAFDQALRR